MSNEGKKRTGAEAFGGSAAEFMKKNWPAIFKPITVLVCICLIVSALLAITNYITAPIIEESARQRDNGSRLALLPDAEDFNLLEGSWEGVSEVYEAVAGGENAGYVITGVAKGYGGEIPVLVAFDADGTIVGIEITGTSETQGLGSKVEESTFKDQFAGLPAKQLTLNTDVQQVAGATISSRAATQAVNNAVAAYQALSGKEG